MKRLLSALFAVVLAMALPLSSAWASGDLDEILDYRITVDVNDDATLDMVYHIDWKVLDSTTDGPLTWVRVGIPNKHYIEMKGLSDAIASMSYSSSGGSYARINLDRAYYAGEVVSLDFKIVQDYMYQVGRDNQGEAAFEFTPGWFDDIKVDNLEVRWNGDKAERIAPAAQQDGGYYVWNTALGKGQRYTVTVGYPDDAFAFDIQKTIDGEDGQEDTGLSDDFWAVIGGLVVLGMMVFFAWAIISSVLNAIRSIARAFDNSSGFTTKKRITRTKVVYYPVCQGCGAARPEGKDTCEYCGRSFIQSEEIVELKDIPAEEKAIRRKDTDGEYAYSTQPNTFLRVHVVPIHVSTGGGGSSSGRGGGSSSRSSCACVSSCACACGCACACACAGGGRAGCTTKDFYNTNLKLSQLEAKAEREAR